MPVGTFGYDDFTIDWYEVFMAWGLDLAELKQLAMNSILFSSMSEEEKQVNCRQRGIDFLNIFQPIGFENFNAI